MVMTVSWSDPAEDGKHIGWARKVYRDIYRSTGGVPVPNEINAGSYINYPDVDLADPEWNTSGVPWHELYYQGNYPRLQRIKATWDPGNLFRHKLPSHPPDCRGAGPDPRGTGRTPRRFTSRGSGWSRELVGRGRGGVWSAR
jgi:hypothetical protein